MPGIKYHNYQTAAIVELLCINELAVLSHQCQGVGLRFHLTKNSYQVF